MYAIYGVPWIPSTKTLVMLALIYQHHGSVMGIEVSTGWIIRWPPKTSDLHRTSSLARTMSGASWRVVGSGFLCSMSRENMAILAHHGAGIFTKLGDFGGQMLGFIFQHHGEPIWAIYRQRDFDIIPEGLVVDSQRLVFPPETRKGHHWFDIAMENVKMCIDGWPSQVHFVVANC